MCFWNTVVVVLAQWTIIIYLKPVTLTVSCLNPRPGQKVSVEQWLMSWLKLRRKLLSSRTEMRWCILTAHWLGRIVPVIFMCTSCVLACYVSSSVTSTVTDWLVFWLMNISVVQISKFPSRLEILDNYGVNERTKLLFFSLSERWGFIGRCRQARLLCLGRLNHLIHIMTHECSLEKLFKICSMIMMAPSN